MMAMYVNRSNAAWAAARTWAAPDPAALLLQRSQAYASPTNAVARRYQLDVQRRMQAGQVGKALGRQQSELDIERGDGMML